MKERIKVMKPLTPEQIERFSQELGSLLVEKTMHEEEKKAFAQNKKAIIDSLDEQIEPLGRMLANKAIEVAQECEKAVNFTAKKVDYVDEDGFVVLSRPLEDRDLQTEADV